MAKSRTPTKARKAPAKATAKVTAKATRPRRIQPGDTVHPSPRDAHAHAAAPRTVWDPRQVAAYAEIQRASADRMGKLTLARYLRAELKTRREEAAEARRGSYRAAINPRRRAMTPFGGTGDQHADELTRRLTRELSRDLDRNAGAFETINNRLVEFLVRDGVRTRPTTADPKWNAKAAKLVHDWMSTVIGGIDARQMVNGYGLQAIIARHLIVDGDVGTLKLSNYRVQIVEADQITGNPVKGPTFFAPHAGIVTNEPGEIVRFNVVPYSETGGLAYDLSETYTPNELLFSALRKRTTQTRGMPLMTSVLDDFERADSYIESEIIAAEVSSQIWVTFDYPEGKNPSLPFQQSGANSGDIATQSQGLRGGINGTDQQPDWVPTAAGSALVAPDGMRANPYNPQRPNRDAEPFVIYLHRGYCAVAGVCYELVFQDLRGMSWSTAKGVVETANNAIKYKQVHDLGPTFSGLYLWLLDRLIRTGKLAKRDDWQSHEHEWPEIPPPDPIAFFQSNDLAIRTGQTSRQRIFGSRAFAIIDELADEVEYACKRARELRAKYPEFAITPEHLIGGVAAGTAISQDGAAMPSETEPAPAPATATRRRRA